MRKTAITDALAKAGFNTAEALLRQLATEAIDKHRGNVLRARPTFSKIVIEHEAAEALIDEALWYYLSSQAFVRASQSSTDYHGPFAGAGNGSAGGQSSSEAQISIASAEPPVRPKPQPPMTLADRMKHKSILKRSVFDSTILSSGHIIARTPIHMLPRIENLHARDAALVRLVMARLPNADPHKEPADYLSEREFQSMIQKSAEMADVGQS